MNKLVKLKRAVIKEEYIALTGDYREAVILNQFIYWSERVKDYDKFIKEENRRRQVNTGEEEIDLQNGWIFKTIKELKDEVMINLSDGNFSKYVKKLVEKKFLSKRRNPKYNWDKTFQYRVELLFIQKELNKLGYAIEGYKDNRFSKIENRTYETEIHKTQNVTAIPEITTETTKNNIVHSSCTTRMSSDILSVITHYEELYMQKTGYSYPIIAEEELESIIENIERYISLGGEVTSLFKIIYKYFLRDLSHYNIKYCMNESNLVMELYKDGTLTTEQVFNKEGEFELQI